MTLSNLIPWGRREVPIKHTDRYNQTPAWGDFDRSFKDMDRLLERFFDVNEMQFRYLVDSPFVPTLDIKENDREFQITLEVPGMDEKDIDITMTRDMMTVSGEKKEEKEENTKDTYRSERRYGYFSRSIPLPDYADSERAEATYKGGVLSIKLPKSAEYEKSVRKIPIGRSSATPGKDHDGDKNQEV